MNSKSLGFTMGAHFWTQNRNQKSWGANYYNLFTPVRGEHNLQITRRYFVTKNKYNRFYDKYIKKNH